MTICSKKRRFSKDGKSLFNVVNIEHAYRQTNMHISQEAREKKLLEKNWRLYVARSIVKR